MLKLAVLLWPTVLALLLIQGPLWFALAGIYAVVVARYTPSYVLMLHNITHRPLFRRRHRWLDPLITWGIGPLLGMPPTAYAIHHMQMHHVEANTRSDLSGTVSYRRDSPAHFLHYWARFALFGHWHLSRYLWARGKSRLLARFWLGELWWAAMLLLGLWLNPVVAVVVWLTPTVLLKFFLMAGNWAQHAFVDLEDPANPWRSCVTLVDTPYNRRCFNDGYHAIHHRWPSLHWTEQPDALLRRLDRLAEQGALIFTGVPSNQTVWWRLMLGDYDYLADRLVDLGEPRARATKVAELKRRARQHQAAKSLIGPDESPFGREPPPPGARSWQPTS